MSERGRIIHEYTVWCGLCVRWDHIESKRNPSAEARSKGWKNTRRYGWVCPKAHPSEAAQAAQAARETEEEEAQA